MRKKKQKRDAETYKRTKQENRGICTKEKNVSRQRKKSEKKETKRRCEALENDTERE
jgi:hypothetical protein